MGIHVHLMVLNHQTYPKNSGSSFKMPFKLPMNSWNKIGELPMLSKNFLQCHQISALLTSTTVVQG
uniref:Uncharacterized protein n=1 Tax=Arundo donax TaxID=35708 RepID=A0A0A9GBU0_ARUDO